MLNKISWSFVQKDFLVWSPRQDTHSFHSLIFMVDKTFFYFLTSSFFEEEDRVLREWEWMFASNALVNSCKMLDGIQLLVVKKASQKQKNHWKTENVMLSRRTEIWDSGARKRRVLLLCAPQSQSSARCANINFFFFAVSIFFFFDSRHGIYPEKEEVLVVSNISHVKHEIR